ncbi:MAG: LamG domain-containing protein [Aliivibrio sp.]|nr:LamG domain-containing protein [Aliivibrio sp.]
MGVAYGSSTIYQATKGIVQDGLVLNLDAGVKESYSGGTTWRDLKSNDNGTLENQASFIKDNGGCFTLDGTDDFIDLGDFDLTQVSTGITVSLWFKGPNTQTGGYQLLIGNGGGWGAGGFLLMKVGSGFRFEIQGNGKKNLDYYNNYWDDTWQNVVGSWSAGNSMKLYRAGAMITSTTGITAISSNSGTGYLRVGGRGSSNVPAIYTDYAEVDIGSVQIYNTQLTDTEVLQNFNVTRHRFGI